MLAMSYDDFKFLRLLDFANLDNWDVKRYFAKSLNSTFAIQSLGQYIIEQNTKIKPFNYPDDDFAILGVDNKVGIFDAYIQKGKEINQPYKLMKEDFLAYNPYRINVGSIGLKNNSHKHQYISPAYVVFSCKQDLLPKYLFLLFKTQKFNKIIREATTGSVRQNLSFDNLSNLQIPLPSLEEQQALVSAYQAKISQAEQLEQQAKQLEQDIENYLFDELGITINEAKTFETGKLQFIEFKDLEKWSLNSINRTEKYSFSNARFPITKLKSVVSEFSSGKTPSKAKMKEYWTDGTINWVSPKDFKSMEIHTSEDLITNIAVNETTLKVYPINTILTVFRSGILRHSFPIAITKVPVTINQDLKAINIQSEKILAEYFVNYLKIMQGYVIEKAGKVGVTVESIESRDFLDLDIVLPTLNQQKTIVVNIERLRDNKNQQHNKAQQLRQQAIQDFETAIFK